MADEFLVVGQVVAAQGLKGEVRILPASDFPQRFTEPGKRWLRRRGQNKQEVQLLSGRQLPGKELFIVRFEGINDQHHGTGWGPSRRLAEQEAARQALAQLRPPSAS